MSSTPGSNPAPTTDDSGPHWAEQLDPALISAIAWHKIGDDVDGDLSCIDWSRVARFDDEQAEG